MDPTGKDRSISPGSGENRKGGGPQTPRREFGQVLPSVFWIFPRRAEELVDLSAQLLDRRKARKVGYFSDPERRDVRVTSLTVFVPGEDDLATWPASGRPLVTAKALDERGG